MKLEDFLGKPIEQLPLEEVEQLVKLEELKFILFSKQPPKKAN